MSRHLLVAAALSMTACAMLPGASDPAASSSKPSTDTATVEPTKNADPAPVADKTPDAVAPAAPGKRDGQIVFSNAPIGKDDTDDAKLVTASTLDKPLYVRAYLPKTPAGILQDNEQRYCSDGSQVKYAFYATLEGSDPHNMDSAGTMTTKDKLKKDLFRSLRSMSIDDSKGEPVSVVPQAPFDITTGFAHTDFPATYRFIALTSMMKPGKNVVTLRYRIGCDGHPGKNRRELTDVATGQITFDVKASDLSAFSRKVIHFAPSADAAMASKLKPAYTKALSKGTRLVKFSADKPVVQSLRKRYTNVRAIVRHKSGKCGWIYGSYQDPNKSNTFTDGHFVANGEFAIPCP